MTIGVDAGSLSISDERLKVGVWRVAFNLLKELSSEDRENTYRLYSFQLIDKEIMGNFGESFENKVITPSAGWSSFWLPLELKRRPVDIFLGLSQSLPYSSAKNIGFIYDLAFFHEPSVYGKSYHQLKNQTDILVKNAHKIITISESSKMDILAHYQLPSERVDVFYPGINEIFIITNALYKSGNPYFLFVGSLNKAKNLSLAIEAFAIFLKKIQKPYDFLLIGGDYWPDPAIDETIGRYHLEERVKKLGFIPDSTLSEYYSGAVALFTTPVREGFCLPAVEAMACGTPVVSVDRGAVKEVVDDGGLISDSIDPEAIADLLIQITDSKKRKQLSENAKIRAKNFSWKKFAENVYELINSTY